MRGMRLGVLALAGTVLGLPAVGWAEPVACQRAIARASASHARAVLRTLQRCEDRKAAGRLAPEMECATEPAAAARMQAAAAKLRRTLARRCGGRDRRCGTPDDDALAAIGWDVGACPGFAGASCADPITDCDDVGACLACVGSAAMQQGTTLHYRDLDGAEFGTGSELNRCQRALGRESARYFRAALKALQRCWQRRLKGRHANSCPEPGDGKAAARMTKAAARMQARTCAACGGRDAVCGGERDFDAAQIGFALRCPEVTMPSGPTCAAGIDDLGQVIGCAGCVTGFEAECVAALAASGVADYPIACNPPPTATTTSTTTTTTTSPPGTTTTTTTITVPATTSTTTTSSTSTTTSSTTTSTVIATTTTSSTTITTSTTLPAGTTTSTSTTLAAGTTTTSTSTTTTTLAPCPPAPAVRLGNLKFTIGVGSTDCGGPGLFPDPQGPFSGEVDLDGGAKRADLALGCLYVGGGASVSLPGARLPDGGTSVLTVAGIDGTQLTVTASPGSGPADCTQGAGPGSHCLNGAPGTDGAGTCVSDADCGSAGACAPDANCFFGPPVPVPLGGASTCIMNAIASDVCGTADLTTRETTATAALSSRLYLTGGGGTPCPQCLAGVCTAGARAGQACSGGVGSAQTTLECPPLPAQYAGKLPVTLSPLSTATTVLSDPGGSFCPGQRTPGAFGGPAAQVRESGSPLLGGPETFSTTLAGAFCVPSSGSALFDVIADLPGPGAVSAPGVLDVCLLPDVCSTVCNPCLLGPLLCETVCGICDTACLP